MRLRLLVLSFFALPVAAQLRSPVVTSIYPPGGSMAGGTQVTIRGTYFETGATVVIGGAALTNVVVQSPATITGTTGARATAGVVNVTVTNPDGGTNMLRKIYTYHDGSCCRYPSFTTNALTGASTQPPHSVAVGNFVGTSNDVVAPANDFNALFAGNGTSSFTTVQTFSSAGNVSATETLDINGDGRDDIAMAPLGGAITTYLGHDTTPFTDARITPSSAFAFSLDSGDFNNDGVPDLVVPDHVAGEVKVCLGNLGGGGCVATRTYSIAHASGVTVGHFNGDDSLDFAVSTEAAGTVTIFLGNGIGEFIAGSPIAAGTCTTTVMGLAAGYLNGDAALDLAVSTGAVLFGVGNGTFTAGAPIAASNGRHVVISDFNRDGKRDIAVDTSLTAVHIMLGDGNGGFVKGPTVNATGGLYDAFVMTDVNANGTVDLIIGGSPIVAMNTINTCPTITVGPASIPGGEEDEPYSVTFTQTGGAGVITFKLTGALPGGLSFVSGTLSGTTTQTGIFPITVTATDANGCSGSASYELQIVSTVPTEVVATAQGLGSVHITWLGVLNADYYQVTRSAHGQPATVIGSPAAAELTDATVVAGTTYVYRVRAVFGMDASADSEPDIATVMVFTDDSLTPGATTIKAVHLTELRTAVNAVRDAAGLSAATFTDASPAGVKIKAVHITELRTALAAARSAIPFLAPATFTNTLSAGITPVRAIDFTEIRNGVK